MIQHVERFGAHLELRPAPQREALAEAMYFAVAVSGLGVLSVAVSYAFRPTERKLALMRPLSLASIFAALASLTAGWAAVLQGAAATAAWSPKGVQQLLMGSSQTLIPVFVTFAFLSVAWLFVAVGAPPGPGIARRLSAIRRRVRPAEDDSKERS